MPYSWFQTSQTGGQQYSDTSPFSIPGSGLLCNGPKLGVKNVYEICHRRFQDFPESCQGANDIKLFEDVIYGFLK